ncbi:unnamed protein product [Cuscuta epithymum]|uniref:Uncharacterized protein n=1 Tax=Cuscuta epithymum TaxID=186058 RepID=A0AAV0F4U7_9ASTE|nr:unnamed protein product [Cuscuta epithymum]
MPNIPKLKSRKKQQAQGSPKNSRTTFGIKLLLGTFQETITPKCQCLDPDRHSGYFHNKITSMTGSHTPNTLPERAISKWRPHLILDHGGYKWGHGCLHGRGGNLLDSATCPAFPSLF